MHRGWSARRTCEWAHLTAPFEWHRPPSLLGQCPAQDQGLGPGPATSAPPARTGPGTLPAAPRGIHGSLVDRTGCRGQTVRTAPCKPSEGQCSSLPNIALGGGGKCPLLAPSAAPGLWEEPQSRLQREALAVLLATRSPPIRVPERVLSPKCTPAGESRRKGGLW